MSLEVLSTAAAIGTFLVIAATAVAALIQLRHMRSGNEIVAVTEFRETYESAHFNDARQRLEEIIDQIDDPRVRSDLMKIPLPAEYQAIRIVANLFETLGAFVKYGIIDENIACDLWGQVVVNMWKRMLPVTAIRRRALGKSLWENYEYLTVLAQDFGARHSGSTYPSSARHLPVTDPWLEEDMAAGIVQTTKLTRTS